MVLVSLVRSGVLHADQAEKIGFAGIENRICVMLTRAKHGMFVFGESPPHHWQRHTIASAAAAAAPIAVADTALCALCALYWLRTVTLAQYWN